MLIARIEVVGEVDARGAVRFVVDSESIVRGMNGVPIAVLVENFSRTGFLFSGDADLPVGTLVSVGLSGAGAREATVVRRDGERHGCEFLVPLPQRDMERAFRGQDAVLAALNEALSNPRVEPDSPPPDSPSPSPSPHRERFRARFRKLWLR